MEVFISNIGRKREGVASYLALLPYITIKKSEQTQIYIGWMLHCICIKF